MAANSRLFLRRLQVIEWLRDLWRRAPLGDRSGRRRRRGRRDAASTRRSRLYDRSQAHGTGSLLGDIQEGRLEHTQGVDARTLLVLSASVLMGGLVLAGIAVLILQGRGDSARALEVPIAPTPYPPNVILCEVDPIEVEQGTATIVNFSSDELAGYELSRIELAPAPSGALDATIDGALSVHLEAGLDESQDDDEATYEMRSTFNLGDAEIVSLCNVRVNPAAVVLGAVATRELAPEDPDATSTPPPTPGPRVIEARLVAPTPTSTPSSTPSPVPSSTTQPRPTLTPGGGGVSTSEPGDATWTPVPTNTRRPTATPKPPTATPVPPTATPVPPTATLAPTATPPPTNTSVPTATQVPPTSTPASTSTPVPSPTTEPTPEPTQEPTPEPTEVPTAQPTVDPNPTP